MTKVLWKYNEMSIRNPLQVMPLEHNQTSIEYEITISHDSDGEIKECAFYISPFTGDYAGTDSPIKDYERVLWLANNYPNHGLSIRQQYQANGEVQDHSNIRIIDLNRFEPTDIFTGQELEITSGPESGNSILINDYDIDRKIFFLQNSFFNNVNSETYRVVIDEESYFKSKQGSSFENPIQMIHSGGVITRQEEVTFSLKMDIPKFAQSAGSFLFDLNLRFTDLSGDVSG